LFVLTSHRSLFLVVVCSLVLASVPVVAQSVIATVPVGTNPGPSAVNTATNRTYVTNLGCSDWPCSNTGTVSVINGVTNTVVGTVNVGVNPGGVAVNTGTNKIFVTNECGNDVNCQSPGSVTVIDGVTLATTTVNVGYVPVRLAVDSLRNKIYVVNMCTAAGIVFCTNTTAGTLTVIDGATLSTRNVTVGWAPTDVAVNASTNTIYVTSLTNSGGGNGTVTVINGSSLATQTVQTGYDSYSLAINSATNTIYATNLCGTSVACQSGGSVTVINGANLGTQNVRTGYLPYWLSLNSVTNKIYVANQCQDAACTTSPSVTVIDGVSLATTSISVCSAGTTAADIEVNAAANQIYLPCNMPGGTVTIINGLTNGTNTLSVGNYPAASAINAAADYAYVPNAGDNTVSVISGAAVVALQFKPVTPCRLIDTRQTGDPLEAGVPQTFPIPQLGGCDIPPSAAAYALNVTVVPRGALGYLTIWPTGQDQPVVSTMNSPDGRTKANAAVVAGGYQGMVSVYASSTTDLILDINGYFQPAGAGTLEFYKLTPCRLADTRGGNFPQGLGGPFLTGNAERDFPLSLSPCIQNIPGIKAYSLNFTAIPYPSGQRLGYLTAWPQGNPQPGVSTLNNPTATVVANAAIIPAGDNGGVSVYVNDDTNLAMDINGYFAAPASGGAQFYPSAPCRVLDTRGVGNGQPFSGELTVNVVTSACAPPSASTAFVFNATVVPTPTFSYLTLWPDGSGQPGVSTLNAIDGFITSNMAIVPNQDGKVDAWSQGTTQLILDISGYFAP
jgi:DNA-binding beta-propeller fold protein YncE